MVSYGTLRPEQQWWNKSKQEGQSLFLWLYTHLVTGDNHSYPSLGKEEEEGLTFFPEAIGAWAVGNDR